MLLKSLSTALIAVSILATRAAVPASAAAYTTVTIDDPAVQMPALSMRIPRGWKFQGTMIDGSGCASSPFPVSRAYSPDGLSEMRLLPRFDWEFVSSKGAMRGNSCLPLTRTLTASEFLATYARLIGAKSAGPMSVAQGFRQRADAFIARQNASAPTMLGHMSGDVDAVRVLSKNGSFEVEQRLEGFIYCRTSSMAYAHSTLSQCSAQVNVVRAPRGKLDALVREVDAENLNAPPPFFPAYQRVARQMMQARINGLVARGRQDSIASEQRLRSAFEQSMALQQHEHEQFLAQMQASTDRSMNAAIGAMNARSTSASDWVDYALDQQTVAGSGGLAKVSSGYSQTWANGQGQWYQTNNPNANPNGVLPGNWSQQTVVHGNGTPK